MQGIFSRALFSYYDDDSEDDYGMVMWYRNGESIQNNDDDEHFVEVVENPSWFGLTEEQVDEVCKSCGYGDRFDCSDSYPDGDCGSRNDCAEKLIELACKKGAIRVRFQNIFENTAIITCYDIRRDSKNVKNMILDYYELFEEPLIEVNDCQGRYENNSVKFTDPKELMENL